MSVRTVTNYPPERGDPNARTLSSFASGGTTGEINLSGELITVFAELLQHMKENNATQTEQNRLMRRHNEAQKKTNRRLVFVGIVVVIGAAVAMAAVVLVLQTAGQIAKTQAKIDSQARSLTANTKMGTDILAESKAQTLSMTGLVEKLEEAPGIVVDEKGRARLAVSITEEQANQLKKPRRRPTASSRSIQVEKSKTSKKKSRALVPLEMGTY